MKMIRNLLVAAVLLAAGSSHATDAALLMSALNANPATNRIVEHQRLQPFPGNLVSNWSGSSGLVVISNVDVGDYNVWIRQRGQSGQIAFSFSITTNDSGTVWVHTNNLSVINVGTYPKTGQAAWSIAAAESRYARKGEAGGAAVTGAELVETSTNNGVVTTLVRTQAVQQLTVAAATNAVNASNLYPAGPLSVNFYGGTLTSGNAQFAPGGFTVSGGGSLTPSGFTGNGALLTNLTADYVSGTLTNNTTGNAATATTATGLDATGLAAIDTRRANALHSGTNYVNLVGSNSVTGQLNISTNNSSVTNSAVAIGFGGINLSPIIYGDNSANANWRAGVNFWDAGYDGSIQTPSLNESSGIIPQAAVRAFKHWGSSSSLMPTMHIMSQGSMRLEPTFGTTAFFGSGYMTIGNEDGNAKIRVNWLSKSTSTFGTNRNYSAGYGLPLYFDGTALAAGGRVFSRPAIWGRFASTNSGYVVDNGTWNFLGELWFMPRGPQSDTTNATFGVQNPTFHVTAGRMLTNGWDFRGRVINEHLVYEVISSTNVPINFEAAKHQTFELYTTTTNLFYTTNFINITSVTNEGDYIYNWTNAEVKELRIRAGLADRYLKWPSGWSIPTPNGQGTLPTWLTNGTQLLLKLTAWGVGETNIVASYSIGADNAFPTDTDAASFFTAASITDNNQKAAVDYLVKARKANNVWTNAFALYPFVGGSSNSHSVNLKSPSTYPITFTASGVTHDANGITGNGSTGYGNTGFNPTNVWGASGLTNCFIAVYNKTASPADCRFMGVTDTSGRLAIGKASTAFSIDGPMNTLGPNSYDTMGSDFTGFLALFRGATATQEWFTGTRTAITARSTTSSVVPNQNIFILARNGGSSTAYNYAAANLAYAEIAWGIDSTKAATLRTIINNFQAMLGRQ